MKFIRKNLLYFFELVSQYNTPTFSLEILYESKELNFKHDL